MNHRSPRIWIFALLAAVVAGVGAGVLVYIRRVEAERRQIAVIGAGWEQMQWLSQSDYVRLRSLISEVQSHGGAIQDSDLAWSLALLRDNPSVIVRARVLGMLSLLGKPAPLPANQRAQLQAAITPLLASKEELDRRYAARVERALARR